MKKNQEPGKKNVNYMRWCDAIAIDRDLLIMTTG